MSDQATIDPAKARSRLNTERDKKLASIHAPAGTPVESIRCPVCGYDRRMIGPSGPCACGWCGAEHGE